MTRLIQYCTRASLYDGAFGGEAGWPAAGMGYIFVTGDNRLMVVDGGHREDARPLLELLAEIAGGVPAVELWVVTHPHMDHYGILREIAANPELGARVTVKRVGWHFPAAFRDGRGKAPCEAANRHMEDICAALGAEGFTPQIGDTVTVDDLELRFLFVPADCTGLTNPNSLSLIFSVTSPRKTALITGDAWPETMGFCVQRYGEALTSDILQLPHHGLCDTGNPDFYRLVGAKILLVPISRSGDRAMKSGIYGDATAANLVAEAMAERVIPAFAGTAFVEL